MSEPYKIYTLHDPDTMAVRYCGFTARSLNERILEHIRKSKTENNQKANWIRSLISCGKTPVILFVETATEENWKDRERFWISHFIGAGCCLVNSCDGGGGAPNPTEAVRAKISKSLLGRKHTEEARCKMSVSAKRRMANGCLDKISKARKKPVIEISTGRKFPGFSEAAIEFGVTKQAVAYWIKTGKFAYVNK